MVIHILLKSIVRPFYRQNAGFFFFLFLVFFGVVAPSRQLAYHYTLITGLLTTPAFLAIVLLAWLLYAGKCIRWMADTLTGPSFGFLNELIRLPPVQVFFLLTLVQSLLFFPVGGYAAVVTGVAFYKGWLIKGAIIQVIITLIVMVQSFLSQYLLYKHGRRLAIHIDWSEKWEAASYWTWLLRYIIQEEKILFGGIKLFGCLMLYLLLRGQTRTDYDLRMPFLVYSLSLFGHGVLIHRCRELEETRLLFYRGLPLPWIRRLGQYAVFYLLLLLPEMIVLGWLAPDPVRWADAIVFALSGWSVLLLMNSWMQTAPCRMLNFLKRNLGVFGILYAGVLSGTLVIVSGMFLLITIGISGSKKS